MIRTVLLDMGNVLVRFCHDRMCAQIGALCGHDGPGIRRMLLDSGLQWDFERGLVTEAEFQARLEAVVGRPMEAAALLQAGSDIFELNGSMPEYVRQLKAAGYRLVLLSNTSKAHFEFVRRTYRLLESFDEYVLSYRVGAMKPEPAIFRAALDAIQCAPGECFYTDDIPAYVAAGREHGLRGEVFVDPATFLDQLRSLGLSIDANLASIRP